MTSIPVITGPFTISGHGLEVRDVRMPKHATSLPYSTGGQYCHHTSNNAVNCIRIKFIYVMKQLINNVSHAV